MHARMWMLASQGKYNIESPSENAPLDIMSAPEPAKLSCVDYSIYFIVFPRHMADRHSYAKGYLLYLWCDKYHVCLAHARNCSVL